MSDLLPTRGYTYDDASELTDLTYSDAQNAPLAGYHWDYDTAGLVSAEYSRNDTSGTPANYAGWAEAEYNYDADSQLSTTGSTDAVTYVGSWNIAVANASVTYDANGNRNDVTPPSGAATTTGAGNQLLYDGQYYYQYDAAGNRIAQWVDTNGHPEGSPQPNDTDITTYTWDNGGQLTAVKYFGAWNAYSLDNPDWKVDYTFDALGRMVSRTPTGITGEQTEYYVYDGQNLALVLDAAGDVVEREFYAPAASSPLPGGSQGEGVLASEVGPATMGTQSVGTVDWYLPDNEGTVRDVVELNGTTTSEVDHLVYDGFGNITSQSAASDQPRFTYAGMPFDSASGMYDDGVRTYAATDAVFASLDPLGFNAGQTNLSEYCGNNPTNYTDPSGMVYITHPYRGPSPAQNRQAFVNAIAPPNRDWLDNTSDFGAGFVDTMPMSGTWFMRQKAHNNGRLGGQVNCNSWYYFLGKVAGIADTVGIALLSGTSGGGTPVRQNPQPVPPPVTPELPPVAPDVPLVSPEAPSAEPPLSPGGQMVRDPSTGKWVPYKPPPPPPPEERPPDWMPSPRPKTPPKNPQQFGSGI